MQQSDVVYDVLRAMKNGTDTTATVELLKQLLRNCTDFEPITPWHAGATACVQIVRNAENLDSTRLCASQFLKDLVHKCSAYAAICVEESLISVLCTVVQHTTSSNISLINNICCIVACVARYEAIPINKSRITPFLTSCDVLRMIGAIHRIASDSPNTIFNSFKAIRRVVQSQPFLLKCSYLLIKIQQMFIVYSSVYMAKRHVQSEGLKLMRVVYSNIATHGDSLQCVVFEQVARIVVFHYKDVGISTLVCDVAYACVKKGHANSVMFVVFTRLPSAVSKAYFRRMCVSSDNRTAYRAEAAMCRLLLALLSHHDPRAKFETHARQRALHHLLSGLHCTDSELDATYTLICAHS